jgi:ADP-ribose pyrophosphatase
VLASAFRDYERYRLTRAREDGGSISETRDLLRGGRVSAVLPVDLERLELVLLRQFRLGAHLANGCGDLVEIVAGWVEPGESTAQAAMRECLEEIGLHPRRLVEALAYLPSPGITDEEIVLFVARVDASTVPLRAGAPHEHEDTQPICVAIDAALAALDCRTLRSGPLIVALQWLALNRSRLDDILGCGAGQAP